MNTTPIDELIQPLESTNPEIREGRLDHIWECIESGEFSSSQLLDMGNMLVEGLDTGDSDNPDSVFRRTFSALLIGVIVSHEELNHKKPEEPFARLSDHIGIWFHRSVEYVERERDFRGFVPDKGWAHSLAHSADLLRDFAFHRFTGASEHRRILSLISLLLLRNHTEVLFNNDDHRFARVVVTVMLRDELDESDYREWLDGLLHDLPGKYWLDIATHETNKRIRFNCIAFLNALNATLEFGMKTLKDHELFRMEPRLKDSVQHLIRDTLRHLDHGLNYQT